MNQIYLNDVCTYYLLSWCFVEYLTLNDSSHWISSLAKLKGMWWSMALAVELFVWKFYQWISLSPNRECHISSLMNDECIAFHCLSFMLEQIRFHLIRIKIVWIKNLLNSSSSILNPLVVSFVWIFCTFLNGKIRFSNFTVYAIN